MRTTLLLCLALSLFACFQPEPDGDDGGGGGGPSCPTFSCSTDADCLQGFVCSRGACSMPVGCGELPSMCPQDGYPYGLNDCLWSGCGCWFNDQPQPQPPPPSPTPPSCECTSDAQAQAQGYPACDETSDLCTTTPQPPETCGEPASCTATPPTCPAGQVPALRDNCYTGDCRAIDGCDVPPACSLLAHEADCTARTDCEPLYTGTDCTDATGHACTSGDPSCTCKQFQFSSCAAR